jgi:hypothetical protein
MSKRAPLPSVLTANRLGDGAAVFLDFEGAWNESIAEALVARSPEEVRALEDRGAHDAARNLVVEPYLIDVQEAAGSIEPIRYRERVRAGGPTVLGDVPGYVAPAGVPSPRSLSPSPRASVASPGPLPVDGERGRGQRESRAEAA